MPASFPAGPASAAVAMHAVAMALAGVLEGLYASGMTAWGGWLYLDGTDPILAGIVVAYGVFRLMCFLGGAATALVLVLAARSIQMGHLRYLLVAGILGLLAPYALLFLSMMTFNCCNAWLLPAITAIPATVVLFDALPSASPLPRRERW